MIQAGSFLDKARENANSERMPALFIGHGNPMNALLDNAFTRSLRTLGEKIERPQAVLVVSAHWLTQGGSYVSTNPDPETIHDFGGFPDELFQVQYRAPGAPGKAKEVVANVTSVKVHEDHEMGLDHGTWTILKHIFPKADIPVFQLSIDWGKSTAYHYALAQELRALRDKGVMIIGSGNIVHNLGRVKWNESDPAPYDWNIEFDRFVKENVASGDHQALVDYEKLGAVARMAHPTNDHYLPLLYTVGVRDKSDQLSEIYAGLEMGSISMRSFLLQRA